LVFGSAAVACGSAAKPRPVETPLAVEAATEPSELHPYADLAAPPAPGAEARGAWIQIRSPSTLWRKLPNIVRGVPPLAVLKDLVEGHSAILPADVSAIVDPSQPVDLVFPFGLPASAVPPTWAFRVRSAAAIARGEAGLTLRRVGSGAWEIGGVVDAAEPGTDEPLGDPDEEGEESPEEGAFGPMSGPLRCRLLHLPAPVDYRVLCSSSLEGIDENAGFLLAAERVSTSPGDVHFGVSGKAYADIQNKARAGLALAPDPSASSSSRSGEELASSGMLALMDHEALTLDVSLNEPAAKVQLDVVYGAKLGSQTLAQLLEQSSHASLPGIVASAPDKEASLTLGLGNIGAPFVRAIVEPILESFDDDVIWPKKGREALRSSLYDIIPHDGRFALTRGLDTAAALAALNADEVRLADELDKPLSHLAVEHVQAALAGWSIVALEVAPEPYLASIMRAYRLNQVPLKTKPGREEKNPRNAHASMKLASTPRGLPPGTLYLIDPTRPNPKYVPPADGLHPAELPYDSHYLVVPDRGRIWLIAARSAALAATQARRIVAEHVTPASQPLTAAASLNASLGMFEALDLDWDTKAQREKARAALRRIERAPRHGLFKMPIKVEVLPRAEDAGWRVRLSSEANLMDLMAEAAALDDDSL
jgi:hypothetical protein